MQKAVTLLSLLVLGWSRSLQGLPVLPEPLYTTQENFNQDQFLGTWYSVALATTCPYMQAHRRDAAIGKVELENSATAGKIKATLTQMRHGTCKQMSLDYEMTSTPGRFFYHISKWGKDVDAYVVHTNYNEYAIMIMSAQKSTGDKSVSLKLYTLSCPCLPRRLSLPTESWSTSALLYIPPVPPSPNWPPPFSEAVSVLGTKLGRTRSVRATVLDDFKTLVKQQGMTDDAVIIRQDKGDCVPGEQVVEPSPEPQRVRRNVALSLAEEEGSGIEDMPSFDATMACKAAPDTGPCFGLSQRYFYNSSSMSCELFQYGGCMGNQNNFVSERECLQRCRTEAVCRLPLSPEPCTGQAPTWTFDSTFGICVPYKVGFCQGNANKFYSEAECKEYCGVEKGEEKAPLLQAGD